MDAKLVVVGGQANKTEIKMKLPMTIGRNAGLGLTINHNMVSRLHCQIYEREGALIVRDNNSSNGTLINNAKISEAVLKPGDRLSVGPLTFVAIYQHTGPFPNLPNKVVPGAAGAKPATPPTAAKPSVPAAPKAPAKPAPPPAAAPLAPDGGWSSEGLLFDEAATPDDLLFGAERKEEASPFAAFATPANEEDEGTRFFNPSSAGFKELDLADLVADDEEAAGQKPPAQPVAPARPTAGDSAARDFVFFVQFIEAAGVDVGTPVRAAGVAAGNVAELNYVQIDNQLRVQAELHVSRKLSSHLREDMVVVIHQGTNGLALIEVSSPGKGKPIAMGGVVEAPGTAEIRSDDEPSAPSATGIEAHLFQTGPSSAPAADDFDNDNVFGRGGGIFDSSPGVLDQHDDEVNLVSNPPTGMAGGGLNDFFAELTSGLDDDEEELPSEEQQEELRQLDDAVSPEDMFGDAPLGEAVEDLPDDEGDIPPAVTDEDDEDDRTISGQTLEQLGENGGGSLFDPLQFDDSDAHR